MELTITPAAQKFIARMLRFSGVATPGFRLVVTPGGCSGFKTEFSVESAPLAGDGEVTVDGLKLFLPAESRLFLNAGTLDFMDTATETGLKVSSPASPSCGCSTVDAAAPAPIPGVTSVSISSISRGGRPA
jgi:iron-sulfur cluster assembly protein